MSGKTRSGNPHRLVLLGKKNLESMGSVRRLDKAGRLYLMDYRADYKGPQIRMLVRSLNLMHSGGCSSFTGKYAEALSLRLRPFPDDRGDAGPVPA